MCCSFNPKPAAQVRRHPAGVQPPVFEFDDGTKVTHPLKFDPGLWVTGARPTVTLSAELAPARTNSRVYLSMLPWLAGIFAGMAALFAFAKKKPARISSGLLALASVGVAGPFMYLWVHVEDRYVGAFFALMLVAATAALYEVREVTAKLSKGAAIAISISLVVPLILSSASQVRASRSGRFNSWREAMRELSMQGVRSGDRVARICSRLRDMNWARELRATIVAEVQFDRSGEFWSDSPEAQGRILAALDATGARLVIANRLDGGIPPLGWQRLGHGTYWVHWLGGTARSPSPNAQ